MKRNLKHGWITIEYVIVAAVIIVLTAGIYTGFVHKSSSKVSNSAVSVLNENYNAKEVGDGTGNAYDEKDYTENGGSAEPKEDKWTPSTDFKFVRNAANDGITITEYVGGDKEIVIPPRIEGLPVTGIADEAFAHKQLTSIDMQEGIREIGESAFAGNSLTYVSVPNSVETIGDAAFYNNQIRTVQIGNNVSVIGEAAFWMNNINVLNLKNVKIVGEGAFMSNEISILYINRETVTIKANAFTNQSGPSPKYVIIEGDETRFNESWDSIFDSKFR